MPSQCKRSIFFNIPNFKLYNSLFIMFKIMLFNSTTLCTNKGCSIRVKSAHKYFTLGSILSSKNPSNSEMNSLENMKLSLEVWKIIMIVADYNLNNFTLYTTVS